MEKGSSQDVALTLDELGIVKKMQGDLLKAEAYWRESLEIKRKLKSCLTSSLLSLGNVKRKQGHFEEAEVYLKEWPGSKDRKVRTYNNMNIYICKHHNSIVIALYCNRIQ